MTVDRFSRQLLLGALLFTSALASAQQTGNPAAMAPDSPKTDPARVAAEFPNTVDQIFTRQAAIGGDAEVALGKLAQERAQSPDVKRYAQMMVTDHGKANDRLAALGKANRANLPKADADPDKRAVKAQLEKLRGADFDVAYMGAQIGDHQTTAQLLEHEIGSGQDLRVKAYAQETLPTVMRHLEMAQEIHQKLVEAPPAR
jgi:putative membrane protein